MFRPAAGLEDTPNEETTSVVHVDVTKNVETSSILPATAVGHAVPDPHSPFLSASSHTARKQYMDRGRRTPVGFSSGFGRTQGVEHSDDSLTHPPGFSNYGRHRGHSEVSITNIILFSMKYKKH